MKIKSIKLREGVFPVYDVINSKPNKNFLLKTDSGKKIVLHNCFLEVVEDSKKSEGLLDQAEAMYHAIYNRMISRFLQAGKLPGLIAMVSSPRFPDDFLHRKIEEAKKDANSGIFWRRRSTWQAKGKKYYPAKEKFYIDTENSEIITDPYVIKCLAAIPEAKFPLDLSVDELTKIAPGFKG